MKPACIALLLSAATSVAGSSAVPPETADAYFAEIDRWHFQRLERLRDANGWLTLVGLHWLEPGSQSVGRSAGNDLQLAVGPARLGQVSLEEGRVLFSPEPGAAVEVQPATPVKSGSSFALTPDTGDAPSVVRFGDANFVVIERSGRLGLRVKDPSAQARTDFTTVDRFPIDREWRFEARFEAHPPGRTIDIASVINTIEPMKNPGAVLFEKDGKPYRLEAVDEGDGKLFLIFADRSNGKSTYGPGRFLYADAPVDNRTVVDFNRAYNPPCAFNAYSTCPLPPPENRLDLVVDAGEKKYQAAAAH